jgi:hypothetical protein
MIRRKLPTPFTVQRIRRVQTGENALGQPIYEEQTTDVAVYGWQPVSEDERNTAALAGRTITDLKLLTPDGDWRSGDAVIVDDTQYEINGDVENYNTGPFGYQPGYAVNLRRVADG